MAYGPDALDVMNVDLTGKNFIVTGANSGCGKELTKFLAGRGATVFMVCRSLRRADAAKQEILQEFAGDFAGDFAGFSHKFKDGKVMEILLGDVSVEEDVRRIWDEFNRRNITLDGLILNAGALLEDKQLTKDGVEVTLASHLLFGVYLLGSLAMPSLSKSSGRCLIVSSAGMLQHPFPSWETAASLKGAYDGTVRYCQMKRGQVILAKRWSAQFSDVKVVSVHPGWAKTGCGEPSKYFKKTDDASGADIVLALLSKTYEPRRNAWEAVEGMAWLLSCPADQIESGEFYLDRRPQVQHMAGPCFMEGSYTKNTAAEVDVLMQKLESWANGGIPSLGELKATSDAVDAGVVAAKAKCQPMDRKIDIQKFMGRWFIVGSISSFLDKNSSNGSEEYAWNEEEQRIDVTFTYMSGNLKTRHATSQTAKPGNENQTAWDLSFKLGAFPVKNAYIIIACNTKDYSTCVVGDPGRNVLYLMARTPEVDAITYETMKLEAEAAGYDRFNIAAQPQIRPRWKKTLKDSLHVVCTVPRLDMSAESDDMNCPDPCSSSSSDC